ncbi:protein unc-13 homolog [Dendrobium catenatum]|uniref:protein unc-13 homolog n=1 Tax=Dendrobium catenatum TaxID=906689 RepID=UPI0009F2BB88|nr:protein unc-13 homolog [Dendrobium catenatum]
MARLLRERGSPGHSRRESAGNSLRLSLSKSGMSSSSAELLPSPFGELSCKLSDAELRETAYEIFVSACRTTTGKPLTFISQPEKEAAVSATPPSAERSPSPSLQRSLTSTAASKMKKALGLKPSKKNPVKDSSPSRTVKKPATVGELIRVQMGVSEQTDSRIRRGLLRISASQLGRRVESIVLPLELLQQFKASDFPDLQEYETWRSRNLKVLEAGLLLHPFIPLEKSDIASQRLKQIIRGASENPIDTGKNSESMQVLRSAVMSLAYRTTPGFSSDVCHWADGSPLNLNLYQMLLDALFDYGEGSIVEEIDEVLELFKKTWVVLGINQMIHNLCFLWFLFHCFVTTGQTDGDLLLAADNLLVEIANDAKTTKDPIYSKILSSILSSIMGWAEKRLLAYHETFNSSNIELMQCIVSLGVSAAKILVDDIAHEYRRRRREEVDVARSRIDTYIRSSLRTAFAQTMEKVDSIRRSSKTQNATLPVLAILAKDIGDLAKKEKEIFSPIFKRWHPLAAGVAVATLHSCYGNELKQFISGVTDLTFDSVQVLKAAQKLEKDLVLIAVEDSVDSEDGGKGLIREMPPYEAESAISSLTKAWVKARVDKLGELVDRNLQQEMWNPRANKESFAPSSVEVLRLVDEALDAFFQLPIPFHPALLPDLIVGLDRCLQYYVAKTKAGCGTRNSFIPPLPALTRVEIASKLWKKKDKSQILQRRKLQDGTLNGENSFSLVQFCVRMNTLHHIHTEVQNLEKKISTCLKNLESSQAGITNGFENKFELTLAASLEGIQQLCEATAYKMVFYNLSHVLWNFLYVGDTSSSRIDSFVKELDPNLETISTTVHNRVRNRVVTALMKASFDGFLLVLLAGGPSRAFTRQDSQILEEDFKALKDLYFADGDGLPLELVEKAATQVKNILTLFRAETESLILRFKQVITETYGATAKARYPMPPTTGHWSPAEANTILRVLCHRNDEAASKFLKKTYNLPKKL